ncbi:MAG: type II secretion system F family protein [Thermoguttaceae bacterium]|nr:type II secretion system F family protein [Thermoguttaceae bacterium]MDW8039263.1 type II secretion system F family protein [Thermoguttaceae bacterium]
MTIPPLWIGLAVFIGVTALVAWLATGLRNPHTDRLESRLQQYAKPGPAWAKQTKPTSLLAEPLEEKISLLEKFLSRFGNFSLLFEQADVAMTVPRLVLISGGLAVLGGVLGLLLRWHGALIPVGLVAGGSLPMLWILWRRKQRLKQFAQQLPDAMEMLARALRAGQSLAAGFQLIASEMPPPIGKEFGRVFEEQNLGIPMEESLREMTERVPNLDLKFFATAVILQRQTGGDLAEILDKIGRLIRERFQLWGQVQALTAEGRLSGVVLLALPILLFFAVYHLNRDYVMVLFTDPMGKKMLAGAIGMQLLGALVIKKIVNIQV